MTYEAIRFMESSGSQPFFLYLSYNPPHSPFQLPEQYYRMYEGLDIPDVTKAAYGMCTNLDDNVARLAGSQAVHSPREATSMAPKPTRDIVARGEARVMHWGVLTLGTMSLEAGETKLEVNALSKPGAGVMDLKAVVLRRLE